MDMYIPCYSNPVIHVVYAHATIHQIYMYMSTGHAFPHNNFINFSVSSGIRRFRLYSQRGTNSNFNSRSSFASVALKQMIGW